MDDSDTGSSRLYLRTSREVEAYLDDLAAIGIHGKTRAEVAKTLIGNAIEQLIKDGILKLKVGKRP